MTSSDGYLSGFYNVELHHHLDGSLRVQTIKEVAQNRGIPFDDAKFEQDLKNCHDLPVFLNCFDLFLPIIQGDAEAIERIAYEAVEDHYNNNVAYFETRFAPHLLLPSGAPSSDSCCQSVTCLHDVIDAVMDGLERGEKDFGVKSGLLLCALRGKTEWLVSLTKILKHYKFHPRLRGIDMAGNENMPWTDEELELTKNLFRTARSLGYGCTFHAGEQGMTHNISKALDEIKTTRIGHGYALFKDQELLNRCLVDRVHFEYCPISADTLGSLQVPFESPDNPIKLGLEKEVNFSLNCDDALFFGNVGASIDKCQKLLKFTELDLFRIRENAARASFLPEKEKALLICHILKRM